MSIAVTPTFFDIKVVVAGGQSAAEAKLAITGLTAGADNTVPHGLPRTPRKVILVPGGAFGSGALGLWSETQAADATNVYLTVNTGGATSGNVYVEY